MKKHQSRTSGGCRQAKKSRGRRKKKPARGQIPRFQNLLRNELLTAIRGAVAHTAEKLVEHELQSLVGVPWSRKEHPLRRNGSIETTIHLDGEPYSFQRPRVRDQETAKEIHLKSVEALQSRDALNEDVHKLMARGISTRNYEGALTSLSEGLGLKRSAVSRAFKAAARGDLDQLNGRSLSPWTFAVVFLDGIHFKDTTCIVALGVTSQGEKIILGVREGASENSTLIKDLLEELPDRGFTLVDAPLFVVDGSKALRKAVRDVFGKRVAVQRCLEHKKRNILSYLPPEWQREARRRLNAAWGMEDADEAEQALRNVLRWLRQHSEPAARSLEEGLEESLTVHRLGCNGDLRRILSSTNTIESALGTAREFSRRVKRWRDSSMVMRWLGSGLLRAEQGFRKIKGFRQVPALIQALKRAQLTTETVAA